eukprot:CAMPEP_0179218380 /NCGR_PEP_ID=MMETSP0797-20121207/4433_1 /TAXON_ID=47934 /ORGANISM="Dinophysis acuminata, Strain DAEP01" /LENGTH=55 /DNA_ID=CAMNT_0020924705 /DNA_START=44 /DNA_END=211 /DNA_ORIENTATION=+
MPACRQASHGQGSQQFRGQNRKPGRSVAPVCARALQCGASMTSVLRACSSGGDAG